MTALSRRRQADRRIAEVRALVRNVTKARELLGCKACDREQGSFEKQDDEKREPNRTERLLRRCALANPTVASYV